MATFPPVSTLLPHADPSVLIDRVVEADSGRIRCDARIGSGNPYVRGEAVPGIVMLEMMAQAVAAHVALARGRREEPPAAGFLIAVRGLELCVAALEVGAAVTVDARSVFGSGRAATFDAQVSGDTLLATARLTVYEPAGGAARQ